MGFRSVTTARGSHDALGVILPRQYSPRVKICSSETNPTRNVTGHAHVVLRRSAIGTKNGKPSGQIRQAEQVLDGAKI